MVRVPYIPRPASLSQPLQLSHFIITIDILAAIRLEAVIRRRLSFLFQPTS
jgi:hypothetical protein